MTASSTVIGAKMNRPRGHIAIGSGNWLVTR